MTTLATPRSRRTRDPTVCHAQFDDHGIYYHGLTIQGPPLRAVGRPVRRATRTRPQYLSQFQLSFSTVSSRTPMNKRAGLVSVHDTILALNKEIGRANGSVFRWAVIDTDPRNADDLSVFQSPEFWHVHG